MLPELQLIFLFDYCFLLENVVYVRFLGERYILSLELDHWRWKFDAVVCLSGLVNRSVVNELQLVLAKLMTMFLEICSSLYGVGLILVCREDRCNQVFL